MFAVKNVNIEIIFTLENTARFETEFHHICSANQVKFEVSWTYLIGLSETPIFFNLLEAIFTYSIETLGC